MPLEILEQQVYHQQKRSQKEDGVETVFKILYIGLPSLRKEAEGNI